MGLVGRSPIAAPIQPQREPALGARRHGRHDLERVEEFATKKEWKRSYKEIRNFEQALTDEGTVLVKIWMHLSDQEQLKRFEARAEDPLKQWKLTEEDWRNREKRGLYEEAVEDMFKKTSTDNAPWTIIPAENKRYARVAVIEAVNRAMEEGMTRWGIALPE